MDYLGGILNRALNATPVAERRPTSMYEPKQPENLQPQEPIELNEERFAPEAARPKPGSMQTVAPPNRTQPVPEKAPARAEPSVEPMPVAGRAQRPEAPEAREERIAPRPQPSPTPEVRVEAVPNQAASPVFERPVGTVETVFTDRVEHVERERHTERTAREVVETNGVEREMVIAPRIERSPFPIEAPSRRERSEKPSEAVKPAPPAIEISIGRIEVRASMTPPAPSRPLQRSKEPQVGLDAYLKSRSGGKK